MVESKIAGQSPPAGRPKARKPAAKAPLKDRILHAALEMTRESGLDQLSMRALADTLSIGTMSSYYHFETREELVDEIVNSVIRSITTLPDMGRLDWREHLRLLLRHVYDVMIQYPGVARAFYDRSILVPGVRHADRIRLADRFASIFKAAGMDPVASRRALAITLGLVLTLADRATRRTARSAEFVDSERQEHDLYQDLFPSYFWSTSSEVPFEAIDLITPAIEVLVAGLEANI